MSSSTQDVQTAADREIEAAPPAKAAWETYMDEELLLELDPVIDAVDVKLVEVVRSLLQAPEDDAEATSRAVSEYQSYFHREYLDEETNDGWHFRHDPANGSSTADAICQYSCEMAAKVPVDSVGHRRMAEFVAGFKKAAPPSFDPKDPQLLFDDATASGSARELWDGFSVPGFSTRQSYESYDIRCSEWLNVAGFMARLLDLGVFGVSELLWVFGDLEEGLEGPFPAADSNHGKIMHWQCQAAVAAQHILIAGHAIAEEIKSPTTKWYKLRTMESWKTWAAALEKIAGTSWQEGWEEKWNLRTKARLAHARMVELWPEAFGDL